ncbi:RsmB/NOP family class I SAM-dependent RNA methyltransferase [Saccharospirillum sp. HFRX-1]|uniref:RsmB/NOP family class I SAM-dependent RNA methyltransferase n=1 Tax=unclassified Saccharospirillum TaxID=2633430 RepID=UPI0037148129
MTAHSWPGFRWSHLFRLTEALLKEPNWPSTDRWLAERFRSEPKFGRKDRAFYSDAFFRLCRQAAVPVYLQRRWQGETSEPAVDRLWPELKQMAPADIWVWLVLLDGADNQLPREITDGPQRRAWLDSFSADDRATLNQLQSGWLSEWDHWLVQRARASDWNDVDQTTWLTMQNQRPPLWLRLARGHENQAEASLRTEGFECLNRSDQALAITARPGLERSQSWQSGWVEIQDKASQAVAAAVALQPGERCWDVCAGAGGKALALLDAAQPNGEVLATDIRPGALNQCRQRAARQGLNGLNTAVLDGTASLPDQAPFDAVLVDAPCTGAGTWRRSPDARWRLTSARLAELNDTQDALLAHASNAVKTGGRLVYATCSWLVAENEDRVAHFLAAHPHFTLTEQRLLGAPQEDADTLFVAVMQRH